MCPASDMKGYNIGDPSPILAGKHCEDVSDDDDNEEPMAGSALFPGSDFFFNSKGSPEIPPDLTVSTCPTWCSTMGTSATLLRFSALLHGSVSHPPLSCLSSAMCLMSLGFHAYLCLLHIFNCSLSMVL
jgi:hypothetical protein